MPKVKRVVFRKKGKKYLKRDVALKLDKVALEVVGVSGNKEKEKNRKSKDKGRINVLKEAVAKASSYSSTPIGEMGSEGYEFTRRRYRNALDDLVSEWVSNIPEHVRSEMYREYKKSQIRPLWDHEAFVPWYLRILWEKGLFMVMYPGVKKTFLLYLQRRYGIEFLEDSIGDGNYDNLDQWKMPTFPLPQHWLESRAKSIMELDLESREPLVQIKRIDLEQGKYPFEQPSGWSNGTHQAAGNVGEIIKDLFKWKMVSHKVRTEKYVPELREAAGMVIDLKTKKEVKSGAPKGKKPRKDKEVKDEDWVRQMEEEILGK